MKLRGIAILASTTLFLAGCGESSLNPFNWFGDEEEVETVEDITVTTRSTDRRPLMPVVSSVILEDTPGGVIVRATGLPPTQGWFEADLVSNTRGEPVNGILTYEFRAIPPAEQQAVSTIQSREVIVGRFVSDIRLAQTREIRVVGETNTVVARP